MFYCSSSSKNAEFSNYSKHYTDWMLLMAQHRISPPPLWSRHLSRTVDQSPQLLSLPSAVKAYCDKGIANHITSIVCKLYLQDQDLQSTVSRESHRIQCCIVCLNIFPVPSDTTARDGALVTTVVLLVPYAGQYTTL
jgi:hypothetical protein